MRRLLWDRWWRGRCKLEEAKNITETGQQENQTAGMEVREKVRCARTIIEVVVDNGPGVWNEIRSIHVFMSQARAFSTVQLYNAGI